MFEKLRVALCREGGVLASADGCPSLHVLGVIGLCPSFTQPLAVQV